MSVSNGRYPDSMLAPIPGGRLRKDAALRWNAMCTHLRRKGKAIPMPNGSQSSYRTYAGQVAMRRMWCARGRCSNAAVPGNSNHGRGISVDTNQGATVDSVPQFGWHRKHSDAPWESWHRTWGGYGVKSLGPVKLGDRVIRKGCAPAADIRQLKRLLRSIPVRGRPKSRYLKGGKRDSVYGITARRAVRHFQRDHKLKADGIVGPVTLRLIRRAAN